MEELERIVGRIRTRWHGVEIWIRADSGFARERIMAWCEANRVEYVLGLARNKRLHRAIGGELEAARQELERTGRPGFAFPGSCSALPTTRRSRLQLLRVR